MVSVLALAVVSTLLALGESAVVTEVVEYDGLQMYTALNADVAFARKAAIWTTDEFGFSGGRTREMAERLAEATQLLVVVPEVFRGDQSAADPQSFNWHDRLQYDYYDRVQKWLHEERLIGADCVAVGNAVGSYAAMHVAVDFMVKAVFVTSPEHVEVVGGIQDETEEDLYSPGLNNGRVGVYYAITPEESPDYRVGSQAYFSIDDLTIVEYPCPHGFFVQGENNDCVDQAFNDMLDFFSNYVSIP